MKGEENLVEGQDDDLIDEHQALLKELASDSEAPDYEVVKFSLDATAKVRADLIRQKELSEILEIYPILRREGMVS